MECLHRLWRMNPCSLLMFEILNKESLHAFFDMKSRTPPGPDGSRLIYSKLLGLLYMNECREVSLSVDSINSYIAWDFSLVQGRVNLQDIGFSIEYTDSSGQKTLILPYQRYENNQGNFCTIMSGNYKLIWDNSYSSFFKKVLHYKVDCIPPVVEPVVSSSDQAEEEGQVQ